MTPIVLQIIAKKKTIFSTKTVTVYEGVEICTLISFTNISNLISNLTGNINIVDIINICSLPGTDIIISVTLSSLEDEDDAMLMIRSPTYLNSRTYEN